MKKLLTAFFITLYITLIFVVVPVFSQTNLRSDERVVLSRDEIINEDYFAAGETIIISGTVNGDAYVAGGNILVDGTINGDLLAAGGTITIRGSVTQDVRVAGGEILVSGDIAGNITPLGGSINITDSANIGNSLTSVGGSIKVFAPIGKGVTIAAGQVTLGNDINGNVNAAVEELLLTGDAAIQGNLTYWSKNKVDIQDGAQIAGKTTQNLPGRADIKPQIEDLAKAFAGFAVFLKIAGFITYLIIGLLFVRFIPVFTKKTSDNIIDRPWMSLLVGFLTVILFPIIFIILLVTVIGIPIAFILLAIFLILAYLTRIFVSLAIGRYAVNLYDKKSKTSMGWTFVIGLVIYEILTFVPFFGGVISFFVLLFGLGAILLSKKYFYTDLRTKKII